VRRKPRDGPRSAAAAELVEGLGKGAATIPELGRGIGEALSLLTGGNLPIPQPCRVPGCQNGLYSSTKALRVHIERCHPSLTERERTLACDDAKFHCARAIATSESSR